MTEAAGPKDLEGRKLLVVNLLRSFAQQTTSERERRLVSDVVSLKRYVDCDLLHAISKDGQFDLQLARAADTALKTAFDGAGEIWPVFEGPAVIVALGSEGKLRGYYSNHTANDTAAFGNVESWALAKALCALHLHEAGMPGGISPENLEYLETLGLKPLKDEPEGIFMGTSSSPIGEIHLAASGLRLNPHYLQAALGGAIPNSNTFAGLFERTLCDLTADGLRDPGLVRLYVPEPAEVRAVRPLS